MKLNFSSNLNELGSAFLPPENQERTLCCGHLDFSIVRH